MEDGFSMLIWALQIQSDALWAHQCPRIIPGTNQQYTLPLRKLFCVRLSG